MSDNNAQKAYRQFVAVFRRMLSTGRKVASEDALRAVKTPDGFDRRAFGPIVASMAKDGEIVPAGFRVSENAKHRSGIKRLWMLASANKKREAGNNE